MKEYQIITGKVMPWILGLFILLQTVAHCADAEQWTVFETSYESAKAYP
jgi:hypothetical protein